MGCLRECSSGEALITAQALVKRGRYAQKRLKVKKILQNKITPGLAQCIIKCIENF